MVLLLTKQSLPNRYGGEVVASVLFSSGSFLGGKVGGEERGRQGGEHK